MGLLDFLLGMSVSGNNDEDLKVGDWVLITSIGEEGEIIEIHGNDYIVEIDDEENDVDVFRRDELRKI